ncbi:hypothetical protein O0L34_g13262 [Tuta absoluta]|nr:hypothetical protein O0L34_g13262 [Tuta absoluta]
MESNGSGDLTVAKTKRKRHRKPKLTSSNLSERLNPNFDLIDAIVQKANASKQRLQNTEKSVQDVDLLVKSYPQVIHDYLQKILKFLQSDQTELCFPNVAPFREEFLIKIAENHSLLNVVKFWDVGSVRTANEILDVLGRSKDVFKWVCAYEDGRVNKNVLVYKKIFVNKSQNKQVKTPASKELTPSVREIDLKNQQPVMPPGLKITMLNTTLKFVKDPTRKSLEYPEMTLPQALYVHNLIQPSNKKDGDLGSGFKSMYSVLHETIDDLKDKYDFHFELKKNSLNNSTTKLVLNKIPKGIEAKSKKIKKNRKKLNSSLESTSSSDVNKINTSISSTSSTGSKLSRSESAYLSKQRIIKKLSEETLKGLLEKFLEFVDDGAMASVEFKCVNVLESRFLESLVTISRLDDYYCLFTPECEVLLKRVSRAIRRKAWSLSVNIGKLCRKTTTRTIVFFKSPYFASNTSENQPPTLNKQANSNKADGMASAMNIPVKHDINDGPIAKKKYLKNEKANDRIGAKVTSNNNAPSSSQSNGHRKTISFLNAGSYTISETDDNVTQNGSNVIQNGSKDVTENGSDFTQSGSDVTQSGSDLEVRIEPLPASRKGRLLQALTTPLESDRAERIMRMMGWEGGALGLRGEGITEPILPALHIAPGAGLGHVKQQPPATLSALESRISFLQSLLTFLKSSANETKMTFSQPMTKRQCSFVKHTMPVFNERKSIGLNADEEVDLVDNIIEEMIKDLTLYIEFKISADKKTLHLVKTVGPKFPLPKHSRKKIKAKPKHSKMVEVKVNDDNIIDITKTTEAIESLCPTRKAAKYLAYKIKFLEKVKEFLANENEFVEHKYDDKVITKKLGNYFDNVIKDINKKAAPVRSFSEIEKDLFKEIKRNSEGCYVSVSFDDRTFRLQKKFAKNQVNPIDSLPPPKSKDLKNTIIYQNNKVIPADKYTGVDKNNTYENDQQTKHKNDFVKDTETKEERDGVDDILIETNEEEESESPNTTKINSDESNASIQVEDFDTSNDSFLEMINASIDSLKLNVLEKDNHGTIKLIKHDLNEVNNNDEVWDKNGSKI